MSESALVTKTPQRGHRSDDGDLGTQAWIDSDDERVVVSLASNPRLRKLRLSESEDLVNGGEYARRLGQQFERLYPVPEWASPPSRRKSAHKSFRRHPHNSLSSDNDESTSDMSIESEDLSTQPLAKLLRNTNSFIENLPMTPTSPRRLRPEVIDIQRTKDVGSTQPVSNRLVQPLVTMASTKQLQSSITSLAFHPIHPLLLSSGPSSMLSLYHISPHPPAPNPLLTSLHLRHPPLSTSIFLPTSGSKIFFSGRRRYFHVWDLSTGKVEKVSRVYGHRDQQRSMESFKLSPCGRWIGLIGSSRKGGGFINVLNAKTGQWVAEARVEGRGGVADFAWWGDGEGLTVIGKGGEAIEWDGREKRVVARWIDEGAVGITMIALSGKDPGSSHIGGDRWVAVGSSSGVVNMYDRRMWESLVPERPKPVKTFDQLVTPISHLEFSNDGRLLCMASRWKRDALRLIHTPSCTVYKNWPTAGTPLGRVSSVAWSFGGEYLAVGNEQGKIRLWEIRN